MNAGDWSAIALWASVVCFVLAAFGVAAGRLSFVLLGIAFALAGVYAIPAL